MEKLEHILVTLDGSELSEKSLTAAVTLANLSNAEITLLRVLRPIDDIIKIDEHSSIFVDQQIEFKTQRATRYLKSVQNRIADKAFKVSIAVEMGPAAEIIIEYANNHSVDLIVMSTHGRSGLQRWVYGSVAGKVLRGAYHPVLLVRSFPQAGE